MLAGEGQEIMRSLDKRRADYFTPDVPPDKPEELPTWLFNQLQNMASAVFNVNSLHTEKMYALPPRFKPREGDIVLSAAGLMGVSEGLYYYNGVDWVFIA
jgi:hypothetical protein